MRLRRLAIAAIGFVAALGAAGAATAGCEPGAYPTSDQSSTVYGVLDVLCDIKAELAGGVGGNGHVVVDSAPTTAVTGTFWQATQPVSGTFWQATQPVSLASLPALSAGSAVIGHVVVDTAPTTPVTGAFFQATQPVSLASLPPLAAGSAVIGHVVVDSAPTTAVTGTFWPATQPVSGTFWQATQPVSLASLPSLAAGSAVIGHVVVDSAPTTAVTGTFWQATQPVSLASLPALAAGSAVIGHVIVDTAPTTAASQSGSWTVQPGNTPNTSPWLANPTQLHPSGATQETCSSGNVANATTACTLAASSGKTTYIAGFSMTGSGATSALVVNCTLTGVITGTMTFIFAYPSGATVGATPLTQTFSPPIPASGANTTIVASCPAGGTSAAHAAMNAWGYQE